MSLLDVMSKLLLILCQFDVMSLPDVMTSLILMLCHFFVTLGHLLFSLTKLLISNVI